MSFQQQTTFLHHRPVYNVGGHLFSVNEITFGILKHSFPLPAHFNVRSTTNPLPTSSTTSNSATLLNTNNTLVCILSLNGRQETTVLESSQSTSTNTTNTNTSSNKVPLKFIGTDQRSKFKLLNACNLVDFCLLDGTPSGPRMRVYQLDNIYSQLSAEACDYLTKHITATMNNNTGHSTSTNTAIHNIASILGGGGGGKRKKRVFSVPQYLIWHSKDFIPPSVSEQPTAEQVLAFAHYFCLLNNTTPSGFSEVIRQEQLLKLPAANIHTHTQPLATQVLQCIQLCQFSCDHNGTRLLSIKVKEHSWDFELRSSTTLLD